MNSSKKKLIISNLILVIFSWSCLSWADKAKEVTNSEVGDKLSTNYRDSVTINQSFLEQAKSTSFDIEFWYGVPKGDDCTGKPGDFNYDNTINLEDIIGLVNHLFHGAPRSDRTCLSDPNGNGVVNITDLILLVNFIYKGGPKPVASGDCCVPP